MKKLATIAIGVIFFIPAAYFLYYIGINIFHGIADEIGTILFLALIFGAYFEGKREGRNERKASIFK